MIDLGLREYAWAKDGDGLEVIGYEVTGLTAGHRGVVGYAGRGHAGERRWSASIYRSGWAIFTPHETFDSPEQALAAIRNFNA